MVPKNWPNVDLIQRVSAGKKFYLVRYGTSAGLPTNIFNVQFCFRQKKDYRLIYSNFSFVILFSWRKLWQSEILTLQQETKL